MDLSLGRETLCAARRKEAVRALSCQTQCANAADDMREHCPKASDDISCHRTLSVAAYPMSLLRIEGSQYPLNNSGVRVRWNGIPPTLPHNIEKIQVAPVCGTTDEDLSCF